MLSETVSSFISVNPEIHFGKPCVKGTRVTVENILELIEAGVALKEITQDYYPDLNEDQVRACIRYAIRVIQNEEIHFERAKAA